MSKLLFREEQKFGSRVLYLSMGVIYSIPVAIFGSAFYYQLYLGIPWGDKPISDGGLVVIAFFVLFILAGSAYLIFGSKLVTVVTGNEIRVTFKPYFYKPVVFDPEDIDRFEIRTYKPIREYGGWGVRYGGKNNGKAYNVRGKTGLQLYLQNGKKVLIGTQKGEPLNKAMKKMMER